MAGGTQRPYVHQMAEQAPRRRSVSWITLGAAIAAGLAALLLWFEACEDEEAAPETDRVAVERPASAGRDPSGGSADPGEPASDPLCALHAELAATAGAVGTVESPAELETLTLAELDFYRAAADVAGGTDASAFAAMAEYWDAVRRFHEPRGWNPRVELTEAAQVPVAPGDAAGRTNAALQTRCGVTIVADAPGG
jgi:hypothetical protein